MAITDAPAGTAGTGGAMSQPIDALTERLNDPAVAASLVTLLDNAELLSTLVLGLSGMMERGDMIMDAVAEGVSDFKASGGAGATGLPSPSELATVAGQLAASGPALTAVLDSAMVRPDTIALLSDVSEAATEGVATAKANGTEIGGVRDLFKTMRDPEVQRGLGMLVEIAKAFGRRL